MKDGQEHRSDKFLYVCAKNSKGKNLKLRKKGKMMRVQTGAQGRRQVGPMGGAQPPWGGPTPKFSARGVKNTRVPPYLFSVDLHFGGGGLAPLPPPPGKAPGFSSVPFIFLGRVAGSPSNYRRVVKKQG